VKSPAVLKLTEGLLLESEDLLLPWNANIIQLIEMGSHRIDAHSETTFLVWHKVRVFGGIEVNVKYRSDFPESFELELTPPLCYNSVGEQFDYVEEKLLRSLGEAHVSIGEEDYYPWLRWNYEAVCVSLRTCERFGYYLSFMVKNQV
jgi:hypothetical protein